MTSVNGEVSTMGKAELLAELDFAGISVTGRPKLAELRQTRRATRLAQRHQQQRFSRAAAAARPVSAVAVSDFVRESKRTDSDDLSFASPAFTWLAAQNRLENRRGQNQNRQNSRRTNSGAGRVDAPGAGSQ
jgi:hypothetical protein